MNSEIENLLVLQARDKELSEIENALENFPFKKSAVLDKINAEKKKLKDREDEIKNSEVQRNALRTERRALEERAANMNGQRQTLIKKPTEYQALEREIESVKKQAEGIEENEIELLYKIDELKTAAEAEKRDIEKTISLYENEIQMLENEKAAMEARLDEARFKVREAEKPVSQTYIEAYRSLKKRARRPFLAEVKDSKCSGCHLKLSSDTLDEAKKASRPVFCDMCGRLIYFE